MKLIILCLVLIHLSHGELQDFYGDWHPVVVFPTALATKHCLTYTISRNTSSPCKCDDGRNTTLVILSLSDIVNQRSEFISDALKPLTETTDTNVMPLMNIQCTCGSDTYDDRRVIRRVNDNYMVVYRVEENVDFYTEIEINTVYIMAKNIPTRQEILDVKDNLDELKGRKGALLCTKQIYDENIINSIL